MVFLKVHLFYICNINIYIYIYKMIKQNMTYFVILFNVESIYLTKKHIL